MGMLKLMVCAALAIVATALITPREVAAQCIGTCGGDCGCYSCCQGTDGDECQGVVLCVYCSMCVTPQDEVEFVALDLAPDGSWDIELDEEVLEVVDLFAVEAGDGVGVVRTGCNRAVAFRTYTKGAADLAREMSSSIQLEPVVSRFTY